MSSESMIQNREAIAAGTHVHPIPRAPYFDIAQSDPPPLGKDKSADRDPTKQPYFWRLWRPLASGDPAWTVEPDAKVCVAVNGPYQTREACADDLRVFLQTFFAAFDHLVETKLIELEGA